MAIAGAFVPGARGGAFFQKSASRLKNIDRERGRCLPSGKFNGLANGPSARIRAAA